MVFVHDALIGIEVHALVELVLGHQGAPRSLDPETNRDLTVFGSADLTSLILYYLRPQMRCSLGGKDPCRLVRQVNEIAG